MKIKRIISHFGSPDAVYASDRDTIKAACLSLSAKETDALADKDLAGAKKIVAQCEKKNIRITAYGDAEYEIFWDGNPDGLNEQHTFFIDGDILYDVWYDQNQVTDGIAEQFLETVAIHAEPVVTKEPGEQEALAKCRAVLEEIQNSGSSMIETKQENGTFALNKTSIRTDWIHGNDRLINCLIPESGGESMFGGLLVDETKFECDSAQNWREITWWDWTDPWLVSFRWDDSVVAYMDTLTDERGITIMLRIDQPFEKGDDQQPQYFVNFIFDADGKFRNVYVQTNLFMNNAISKTESIVSLDAEVVNAEIQKEYKKATGKPIKQQLPEKPNYAVLEFIDDPGLIVVTNQESVEGLLALFADAELLDGEPEKHNIGVDDVALNLVFVEGAEDFVIELDPGTNLCRVNGEYMRYGGPEAPEALQMLWEYLGITRWPDIVYQVCKTAHKP